MTLGVKEGGTLGVAQAGAGTGGGGGGSFGGADETLGLANKLILDDDADSFLQAATDDVVELAAGTTTGLTMTGGGNSIAVKAGSLTRFTFGSSEHTTSKPLSPTVAGVADLGASGKGWGDLYIDQTKQIFLDDDADSYLYANADDSVRLHAGAGTSYVQFAGSILSVVVANSTHLTVASAGVQIRDRLTPVSGAPTIGDSGVAEGMGALYLQDSGAYTAAVSEVAPAAPNDGHVLFSASTSTGVRELWVVDDASVYTKLV